MAPSQRGTLPYPWTEALVRFMRELRVWDGVAEPTNLKIVPCRDQSNARQTAKQHGWVEFDGTHWRMTEIGYDVLRELNGGWQL